MDEDRVIVEDEMCEHLAIPEVVMIPVMCGTCAMPHLIHFEHAGLHDDGEIYRCLEGQVSDDFWDKTKFKKEKS